MKRILASYLLLLLCIAALAQPVRIWDGTQVKAESVVLTPYLPDVQGPVPAVIICPGGSYFWLGKENEGVKVAQWLQSEGFAAFVLEYRTGGWYSYAFHTQRANVYPAMMQDVQRSIEIVRKDCSKYGVNPECIGTMGFSAGGHLAMSSAEYCGTDFLRDCGIETSVSLRPDFVAAIYPVVSLSAPCSHERSRRGLLGEKMLGDKVMRDSLSLERHVKPDTPPVFLLNCADDPLVDCHNSELLDSALTVSGIPHKYTQYEHGGHGFGVCPKKFTAETSLWQDNFLDWFAKTIKSKDI